MLTDLSQFIPKYFCETCGTKTNNKKDYDKHITTLKHKKLTSVNTELTENSQNLCFECQICKKEYKSRVGLWKHKKICNGDYYIETEISNDPSDKELIMMLIKENSEFKNIMKIGRAHV
jgi:hypothetical protein